MDEHDVIMSSKAMQKMREIADRLFKATPELIDGVSADALLKPKIDSEKH
jgi:hypothetical protein